MKRLSLLVVFVLTGCPNWETERINQCRKIGSTTGACEGTAPDKIEGVRGGNTADGVNALPQVSPTSTDEIWGTNAQPQRLPVFLWELRSSGMVVAVETYAGHISVWRSIDSQGGGLAPQTWCAAAVSDRSTELANAYSGGNVGLSIDDVGGATIIHAEYRLSSCPEALAAYQREDSSIAYLSLKQTAGAIRVERASRDGGSGTFDIGVEDPLLGEAVTDESQIVWMSAAGGPNRTDLSITRIDPEALVGSLRTFATSLAPVKVELATSGGRLHAAWLEGQQLSITELSVDGGADIPFTWTLSEPGRLVDLVESRKSVVAVLEFSGRTALLIHQADADWLFRVATGLAFHPTVAHLGSQLRIAGQCDGGTGCASPERNPLLEFARLPDGGSW